MDNFDWFDWLLIGAWAALPLVVLAVTRIVDIIGEWRKGRKYKVDARTRVERLLSCDVCGSPLMKDVPRAAGTYTFFCPVCYMRERMK